MQQIMFASLASGSDFVINGSGLFDGSTGYLSRTFSATGSRVKWTFETILKNNGKDDQALFGTATDSNNYDELYFAGDVLRFDIYHSAAYVVRLQTTAIFRDPSAYYHIVLAYDSGNGTAGNRVKLYINGTRVTDWSQETYPTLNYASLINTTTNPHEIGRTLQSGTSYHWMDSYLARSTFVNNEALDATDFGELTDDGFWSISDASGLTFGTNSFLIEGGVDMAAGTDSSGNSNNFSKTGSIISTLDSPTSDADNGYGNYATWNPLQPDKGVETYSNGNRTVIDSSTGNIQHPLNFTMDAALDTYVEISMDTSKGNSGNAFGVIEKDTNYTNTKNAGTGWLYFADGARRTLPAATDDAFGTGWGSETATVMIAISNGNLFVGYNGTWDASAVPDSGSSTGALATGLTGHYKVIAQDGTADTAGFIVNSGASTLAYPIGASNDTENFTLLGTAQMPTPAPINYEDEYYIEAGISHSNGSTTAVTIPFDLDATGAMVRIKRTDSTGDWYVLDTVRGDLKYVKWNDRSFAEADFSDGGFSGTTFTISSDFATGTYLLEAFKIGSYFQIKTFTGTGSAHAETFPSALDTAPGMMWIKYRTDTSNDQLIYHESLGNTKYLHSNSASVALTSTTIWNNTSPTTTQFTVGTNGAVNTNGGTYVLYAWANSGPYSFGVYDSNLSADGPMINLSGSPATFGAKRNDGNWNWVQASQILGDNENYQYLENNNTTAVNSTTTVNEVDFLSNGMKMRDAGNNNFNGTAGADHLYWAFGIQPMTDGSVDQSRAR